MIVCSVVTKPSAKCKVDIKRVLLWIIQVTSLVRLRLEKLQFIKTSLTLSYEYEQLGTTQLQKPGGLVNNFSF